MREQVIINPSERGFTLPELMVASVLTLIVMGGAFQVVQQAARATEQATAVSDVNQTMRVAMNIVIRDLIQAGEGDYALRSGVSIPTGDEDVEIDPIVRPSPEDRDWYFPDTYTVLPAISHGNGIGITVNGIATDVVTILYEDRRLDLSGLTPVIPASGASINFGVFDFSDPVIGIKVGDLIRFGSGAMQEITRIAGNTVHFETDADDSRVNQRNAPQGSVMALKEDPNGPFPTLPVSRISMITYYVTLADSGVPQLVRRVNYGDERVIAVGIENFQLSWDLVDGVTNPTNVETFDADTLEGQIRKANVYVAGRSQTSLGVNGQPLRTSLSTQVSLRSLAFVSRYDIAQ